MFSVLPLAGTASRYWKNLSRGFHDSLARKSSLRASSMMMWKFSVSTSQKMLSPARMKFSGPRPYSPFFSVCRIRLNSFRFVQPLKA